jgi:uncharacterized protein YjbI with pentapeptide repeats
VVIAGGGLWFNRQQQERQQEENRQQQERGLEIENQRAQDEALQAYLDQMGQLLLDTNSPLRQSGEGAEVRTLARARTLTVLGRLDGERKGSILQFLSESNLIAKERPVVSIAGADLRKASLILCALYGTDLHGIDLRDAVLSGGLLHKTDLSYTNLSRADLSFSQMIHTDLYKADLSEADLTGAILMQANLRRADLRSANFSLARLDGVDLSGADLTDADLTDAKGMSNEELERQADALEGAIMPNGQKYEVWRRDKGHGQ